MTNLTNQACRCSSDAKKFHEPNSIIWWSGLGKGNSWKSPNTADNVWNKLRNVLCQTAAKWTGFKKKKRKERIPSWYPQCATTSLMWNTSEREKKKKKTDPVTCSARVKFLTGFAWGKESHNLISCNSWRRGSREWSSVPSISSREKLRARKARRTSPSLSMRRHGKARGKKGNNTVRRAPAGWALCVLA